MLDEECTLLLRNVAPKLPVTKQNVVASRPSYIMTGVVSGLQLAAPISWFLNCHERWADEW
jgi:hypothetical protein